MSFLILNYFNKSHLLVSTLTWLVDYKKPEKPLQGSFVYILHMDVQVREWNIGCFLENITLK